MNDMENVHGNNFFHKPILQQEVIRNSELFPILFSGVSFQQSALSIVDIFLEQTREKASSSNIKRYEIHCYTG